jgi:2-C-methyl-D-erythritol 4-phosphate cytidylyltransferase
MTLLDDPVDPVVAFGRVLDEGRGSLPFALMHGEALVTCATWALSEAGVVPLDARTTMEGVVDTEAPLVLHDSLCPMTPPDFIAACVRRAVDEGVVVVGVRPVTDTVKVLHDGLVGETLDRDSLALVASPVVVPATVAAEHTDLLDDAALDLATLTDALRARTTVVLVDAPPTAARVAGAADLRVLEALTRPTLPNPR